MVIAYCRRLFTSKFTWALDWLQGICHLQILEGWIQQAFECLQTAKEHCAEMESPVEAEENKIKILPLF